MPESVHQISIDAPSTRRELSTRHIIIDRSVFSKSVTLLDLKTGQAGVIASISGSTVARLHLMEMGLTPGTELKVVRIGAFGGPLDILIRGYRLSIRRTEAQSIVLADEESATK